MKRSFGFTVDGVEIRLSYVMFAAMLVCFAGGAAVAACFGEQEFFVSRVFSPLSFSGSDGNFLQVITGNFITYSTFVILGMIFSASAFGFLIIPPLTFLLGFSLSGSAVFMMEGGQFLRLFLLCLPLWALFACALMIYYSLCFFSSFSLFRLCGTNRSGEEKFSLPQSLRVFYFMACLSTVFAVISSLLEFLLYRFIS